MFAFAKSGFLSPLSNTSCLTNKVVASVLISALTLAPVGQAFANPLGGQVVAGSATITTPNAATTQINQGSDKAVINWQSFSIGEGETTRFVQPNAGSIALNRVVGQDPSKILGNLVANGQVFLVNPNGVLFSKTAKVDVSGLIASTADITNSNFMKGNYHFTIPGKPDASVINRGTITARDAGLVALVGPGVKNSGVINAKLGAVVLGAGQTATFDFYGDSLINFTITSPSTKAAKDENGKALTDAASNEGTIRGKDVFITARAAKSVVDNAVNMSGVVEANSARMEGGTVVLDGGAGKVSVAGKIDASGTAGGKVDVFGQNIFVKEAAQILANGSTGNGGTIRVGGDFQGQGTAPKALTSVIEKGALLESTSTQANGGTVIVWSDGTTLYQGNISVAGVNGGFIEISGKENLLFDGDVSLTGTSGNAGTLLLDPKNISIVSGNGLTGTLNNNQLNPNLIGFDGTVASGDGGGGTSFSITATRLANTLKTGNVLLAATNLISIDAVVDATGLDLLRGSLTLTAKDVTVASTGGILLSNRDLNINATDDVNINGNIDLGGGNLTVKNHGGGSAKSFSLASGKSIKSDGLLTTAAADIKASTVNIAGDMEVKSLNVEGGNGAPNSVTIGGKIKTSNDLTISGRDVNLNGSIQHTGNAATITAARDYNQPGNYSGSNNLTLDVARNATVSGVLNLGGGSLSVLSGAGGRSGSFTLASTGSLLSPTSFFLFPDGDATIAATNVNLNGTISDLRMLTVDSDGDVAVRGDVTITDDFTVSRGASSRVNDFTQESGSTITADDLIVTTKSASILGEVVANGFSLDGSTNVSTGIGSDIQVGSLLDAGDLFISGNNITLRGTLQHLGSLFGSNNITVNAANRLRLGLGSTITSLNQDITLISGGDIEQYGDQVFQTWGGDFSLTGDLLLLGGNTLVETLGGNITFSGTVNSNSDVANFGPYNLTLNASFGSVDLSSTIGGVTPIGDLSITGRSGITFNSDVTADTIFADTNGLLFNGDIVLNNAALVANGTGAALVLASGKDFHNSGGSVSAPNGNWYIYSTDPANNTLDGIAADFEEFSCTFGSCTPSGSGNGLLYTAAAPSSSTSGGGSSTSSSSSGSGSSSSTSSSGSGSSTSTSSSGSGSSTSSSTSSSGGEGSSSTSSSGSGSSSSTSGSSSGSEGGSSTSSSSGSTSGSSTGGGSTSGGGSATSGGGAGSSTSTGGGAGSSTGGSSTGGSSTSSSTSSSGGAASGSFTDFVNNLFQFIANGGDVNSLFSLAGITFGNFQLNNQPYQFGTNFNLSLLGASGGGTGGGGTSGGGRFNFANLSPSQLGSLAPAAGGPTGQGSAGGGNSSCVNQLLGNGGSVSGTANLCSAQ